MNPKISMPILRQLDIDTDRPFWRRLFWWAEPVVYELVEDYYYTTRMRDGMFAPLVLPAGFRSDLASTPRISWLFGFRPDGRLSMPGLFHDFLYRHGFLVGGASQYRRPWHIVQGKWGADLFFAHLIREVSGMWLPAVVAFVALTLFGWPAWWRNAKYRRAANGTSALWTYQLKGDYR